jgi:Uma2 family endonuclease
MRRICAANPLWRAPRIHGELLKLYVDITQATVGKYLSATPYNAPWVLGTWLPPPCGRVYGTIDARGPHRSRLTHYSEYFMPFHGTLLIMNVPLRKAMTLAEFLDWEEQQPLRYEFDGVQPIAMTGGTAAHAFIQRNLAISIGGRLRGQACQFVGNDLKIEVAGKIRYPNGFVVCSPLPVQSTVVRDPVVVFEVLSNSTARTDLVTKNHEYAATPSVRRYVILSQDEMAGTMFERVGDDWVGHLLAANTVLSMPEIGIEVTLAELYEGVDFSAATAGEGVAASVER